MTMKRRINIGWLVVFAVLVSFIVHDIARASGTDVVQETNVNAPANVQTSLTGGKAFSFSGGDMDIRDCLATHSVLFGLWQGTHINPMCVADNMEQRGALAAAATMRCSTRKFRRVYGRGQDCIDAVRLNMVPQAAPVAVPESEPDDDDDEYNAQQMAFLVEFDAIKSELETLRIEQTQAPARPPQVVERTVIEQKPLLSKEVADSLRYKK